MELIRCGLGELPLLRDVAVAAYEETFARHNTPEDMEAYLRDAFSPERLEAELNNPASAFFLAAEDASAAGYLKINEAPAQTDVHDAASLEIERIYVRMKYYGSGLGARLLEKAIAVAREAGKEYVWLGVWEHNLRAQRFYEKNGFRRFGEHIFRLGSDEQTDFLFRMAL